MHEINPGAFKRTFESSTMNSAAFIRKNQPSRSELFFLFDPRCILNFVILPLVHHFAPSRYRGELLKLLQTI
jgi:hypothetical protein